MATMTLILTGPDVTIGALEAAMSDGGKVHIIPESIYPGYIVDVDNVEIVLDEPIPVSDVDIDSIEPDSEPS